MALIIVGLGNPGKEYEKTRHNAGRNAAELVAKNESFEEFVFNKKVKAFTAKGICRHRECNPCFARNDDE